MHRTDLVVGVDMATAEVRAVAVDGGGRVVAEARRSLPVPSSPRPRWSEQDPGTWWPAVAGTLAEVTGAGGGRVVAVSVCATSGTVVALDGGGAPIGMALTYADQRAAVEAESVGVPPSFGLPKWGWLVAHRSPAPAFLAHASDVVVARLVGGSRVPTDWSHALKSGFDLVRGDWAWDAMAMLRIDASMLPAVRRPTSAAGRVGREAAAATGLPLGCEVRLGMTDGCASQLAAGAGEPGRFVSVLGSTLVIKGASQELVVDPTGAVYSHRHPDGWWLPGGASSAGGRALAEGFPGRDPAELDRVAAAHGPATCVVYPLVGRGERFPFVAPDADGFVVGEPSGEADRVRATLEGVAFVERLGYERLAALGAPVAPPVVVTGGGSRSPLWNRIRATVLGMPVMAVPDACTARGAAILAAAGTLHPDLAAATAAMSASGSVVEPDEEEREAMEAGYRRFRTAVAARGWISD